MIPNVVYMTHESYDKVSSTPKLLKSVNSWKKHKNLDFVFHDNEVGKNFIKDNFKRFDLP